MIGSARIAASTLGILLASATAVTELGRNAAAGAPQAPTQDASSEIRALIDALKQPQSAATTELELAKHAADQVIPLILRSLKDDPAFRKHDSARANAYDALARAHSRTSDGRSVLADDAQIDELGRGLHDSSEYVRQVCARGLALVDSGHAPRVVPSLIASLHDDSLVVVENAANSLGAIGKSAESALPDLLKLLDDPDQKRKLVWDEGRKHWEMGDIEVSVRSACADARISIAGIAVDLALYETLDERGQAAAVEALKGHVFKAVFANQPTAGVLSPETQAKIVEWCRCYLDNAPSTRSDERRSALGPAAWLAAWDKTAPDVRREARQILDAAASDRDLNLATAASGVIRALDKRAK